MNLKEYVFILGSYNCNKFCPYCIEKMDKEHTSSFDEEFLKLEKNIHEYKKKGIEF